ncbi:PREDICTED: uncharacterized protein LOC109226356 [Nicotiana attenuata]|uniref:Uncharacterized protein n=1 Tax=Nicotiana attenuata TaxID=49451 RepID=A0A1J6IEZ4_NICAT|nr:PREDICTED: uncharacterized protein LOC109226356 [Nicotiana attenuata]OIT03629.1 hypothetical protein A4A49_19969 [Nicotiana attenuata]
MGACASKPKVLEGTAPAPEVASNGNVANVAAEEGIVGDDKRQSLGNLFKESEEGKDSEQVKEETCTTETSEPSEPQTEEVVTVLDAHITTDTRKAPEVETPDAKTSVEKATEEVKSEIETPTEEKVKSEAETKTEQVKSETETKIEQVKSETEGTGFCREERRGSKRSSGDSSREENPVTEATKSEALVENKTEEKPATEAKKPVIEEKKSGKFWWDK